MLIKTENALLLLATAIFATFSLTLSLSVLLIFNYIYDFIVLPCNTTTSGGNLRIPSYTRKYYRCFLTPTPISDFIMSTTRVGAFKHATRLSWAGPLTIGTEAQKHRSTEAQRMIYRQKKRRLQAQ
jgi:hypothetical protein